MDNLQEHDVRNKPGNEEDRDTDGEEAERERFEDYAEQYQYRGTDFKPAAGWY